jgi:hypothetical protein
MRNEEAKTAIKAIAEIIEGRIELCNVIDRTGKEAAATKALFREGNQSKLIKWGLTLIAFPEPTPISEIVGGSLVAAGAVNKGIQNRAAFAEDIGKDFKKALRDLSLAKDLL